MSTEHSSRHHEIEAKYRVGDVDAMVAALAARRVGLSAPFAQDDQAYAPAGWAYGMSKVGVPFARLRTTGKRHLFTVKKPVDNEMACLEHECEVLDRDQMHAALAAMGWVPTVRIVKQRRTGSWDGVAVCLDVVDGLGAFVEVERMVSAVESGERVQAGLDAMVRSLGLPVQRVTDTYDTLLRNTAAEGSEP